MTADEFDAPTHPPTDEEEERTRLEQRASQRGIDPGAAMALADELAHMESRAEAYRHVERRLASGMTVEQAEAILLG